MNSINWKYAIGEVIIVIIGISIAFSLNSWAAHHQNQKERQKYLDSILLELDRENEALQENIKKLEKNLKSVEVLNPHFGNPMSGRDTVFSKVFELAQVVNYIPKDITYQTLVNSGDLKLIQDFEVRTAIEEHYAKQQQIVQDYERQVKIHEKYLADFFIHDFDYDLIRQRDYSFMDKPFLKNIVQSLYGSYLIAIQGSKRRIAENDALKTLIAE